MAAAAWRAAAFGRRTGELPQRLGRGVLRRDVLAQSQRLEHVDATRGDFQVALAEGLRDGLDGGLAGQ